MTKYNTEDEPSIFDVSDEIFRQRIVKKVNELIMANTALKRQNYKLIQAVSDLEDAIGELQTKVTLLELDS
jgi:hypothetical protein